MNHQEIMIKGVKLLCDAASNCGAEFEFHYDQHDGLLHEDDEIFSFTTSIKVKPFESDEGRQEPKPVMFQIDYNKKHDHFQVIEGEDSETEISYGNVMAHMYFYSLP